MLYALAVKHPKIAKTRFNLFIIIYNYNKYEYK